MWANILFHSLWIFPVYSFFGWCLEVVYCSVNTGEFVNRGFLNGAACPIYGFGAGFLIFCLTPVQDNLLLLYLGSVVIGSLLELIGGFLLKKIFHMTWWDYSSQPMNIGGYICLKFSLAWGVAGVMLMNVIHPLIVDVILIIPGVLFNVLLTVFYSFFVLDIVITVTAVLKLNRDLREITRLSELIHMSSDRMAESIGNTALFAADKMKELELTEKTIEISERIQTSIKDNRDRLKVLLNNGSIVRSRLLKAFPRMNNAHHSRALNDMKERFKNRVKKRRESKNK